MSNEEEHILAQWLENPQNQDLIDKASSEHDTDILMHHIDHIDKHHILGKNINESWSAFQQKIENSPPKEQPKSTPDQKFRFKLSYLLFILGILGASFYGYSVYKNTKEKEILKTIQTDIAKSTIEYAPDNTKITLGSASSLKYYPAKWPDKRELWLDGEAMFDVAKGSTFDVITPQGTATVVGTEFNVLNTDQSIIVTCYEGKVLLTAPSGNSKIISAGEEIKLTGEIFSDKIFHNATTPSWINGSLIYASTKLSDIIPDLNRHYSKKISLSSDLQSKQFTGVLPINDWDKMIKILSSSMSLQTQADNVGNIKFESK
jgi:transmembrane sensor